MVLTFRNSIRAAHGHHVAIVLDQAGGLHGGVTAVRGAVFSKRAV
jgi:hypothetical protein